MRAAANRKDSCCLDSLRSRSSAGRRRKEEESASFELVSLRSSLRALDRRVAHPDHNTFTLLLELCSRLKTLAEGKHLHIHIKRYGLDRNTFLANFIISMYGKCGSVTDARTMFDNMHQRNVVSWNAMIAVYGEHGQGKQALRLVRHMQEHGVQPKKSTYLTALNACNTPSILNELIMLHEQISTSGHEHDLAIGNALINAYGKCGNAKEARKVFHNMKERDIVSWNSMISAFSRNGYLRKAFELFSRMRSKNVDPDKVTFVNLLSGCTGVVHIEMGRRIQRLIMDFGYQANVFVGTALITMFAKCGCVNDALKSFENIKYCNVVSWNAMIAAYSQCGCHKEARQLFNRMQEEGIKPNNITFINVLDACQCQEALQEGKDVHSLAMQQKLHCDIYVRSALVNMYGKCGSLHDARRVFREIHPPDIVSWTAMIGACAQLGHGNEAFDLFVQINREGMKPNQVTYINVISACASLSAGPEGRMVHSGIIEGGFDSVVEVGNALVNMYSKCGGVNDARKIFDAIARKNVISWTAMLDAYASLGYGEETVESFKRMQQDGIKPDEVTFVSVLTACSHAGLLMDARQCFFSMGLNHGISPNSSHYSCMIDLFGRLGRVDEAEKFLNEAPFEVGLVEWMALLGACRNSGDVARAERAAEQVLVLDPQCRAAYVILSNIYSVAGRWDDVARLSTLMKKHGVKQQPGCSSIEIGNEKHCFVTGDRSHTMTEDIYTELGRLQNLVEEANCEVSDPKEMVLHDVEEEKIEDMLFCQSEKLAIAFGLLSTPPGTSLCIAKNHMICSFCHRSAKIISKIEQREIIIKDASLLHRFSGGTCTCGDYW